MTSAGPSRAENEELLEILRRLPRAVFAAIAGDGVLVPVPDSLGLPAERVIEAPSDRATMLDVVLPGDRLLVIDAWDKTLATGRGVATVRIRQDPEQPMSLSFVDLRAEHGVLLGTLEMVHGETSATTASAGSESAWLSVSRAPRTAVVRKNLLATFVEVDERFTHMLGWTPDELLGRRSSDFIHPEDQERAISNWMELLSTQSSQRVRLRHLRADATWAWLELENQYVPADDPADSVVVTQMNNISDEMAAHEALRQQERLLRRVADSLPVAILQLAADRSVVFANERFDALLACTGDDRLAGLRAALPEPEGAALDAALEAALTSGEGSELEVPLLAPGAAEPRIYAVGVVGLGDREGAPGALLSLADVTLQVRAREDLLLRATTDPLTGAANRATSLTRLEQALADSADSFTAVVFVDLDRFKLINDTLGHAAGDEVLRLTVGRLTQVIRPGDVVGRLGGDEFLLVSRGHDGPETAEALGRRVRDVLNGTAVLAEGAVELRASIGVACGRSGWDADALVREADRAMYCSKQADRGEPVVVIPAPRPGALAAGASSTPG